MSYMIGREKWKGKRKIWTKQATITVFGDWSQWSKSFSSHKGEKDCRNLRRERWTGYTHALYELSL